jgi:hypothetical protein
VDVAVYGSLNAAVKALVDTDDALTILDGSGRKAI